MSAAPIWTVDEDGPDDGQNWWTVGNDQNELMFSTEEQSEAEWLRDALNSRSDLLAACIDLLQHASLTEHMSASSVERARAAVAKSGAA